MQIHVVHSAAVPTLLSRPPENETLEQRVFRRYSAFCHSLIRQFLVFYGEGPARVEFLRELDAVKASECPGESPKSVGNGLWVFYDPNDLLYYVVHKKAE